MREKVRTESSSVRVLFVPIEKARRALPFADGLPQYGRRISPTANLCKCLIVQYRERYVTFENDLKLLILAYPDKLLAFLEAL